MLLGRDGKGFIGASAHIIDPCTKPHATSSELLACKFCTKIESFQLGSVHFDLLFTDNDTVVVDNDGPIHSNCRDINYQELENNLRNMSPVPHTGDNICEGLSIVLSGFGINMEHTGDNAG